MFYSTELLPKGGKFNLVWLLSTTTSPGQLAKKRRKDLLKINIQGLVRDLLKMFPAAGKKNSFSLRTSSILAHGLTFTFRVKCEILQGDIFRLQASASSSRKTDTDNNDARPPKDPNILLQFDHDTINFGQVGLADNLADLTLTEAEVSARRRAVTMSEDFPAPSRLSDDWDWDLPRMSIQEMEDQESLLAGEAHPLHEEVPTAMDLDKDDDPDRTKTRKSRDPDRSLDSMVAPEPVVKPRTSQPRVEVTPAMPEDRPSRVSPHLQMNNMDVDLFDDPIPVVEMNEPSPVRNDDGNLNAAEEPTMPHGHEEQPNDEDINLPLGDLEEPTNVRKHKKRKICVWIDEITQIPGDTIKANLANTDDILRKKEAELPEAPKKRDGRNGIQLKHDYEDALDLASHIPNAFDWDEDEEVPIPEPMNEDVRDPDQVDPTLRDGSINQASINASTSSFLNLPPDHNSAIGDLADANAMLPRVDEAEENDTVANSKDAPPTRTPGGGAEDLEIPEDDFLQPQAPDFPPVDEPMDPEVRDIVEPPQEIPAPSHSSFRPDESSSCEDVMGLVQLKIGSEPGSSGAFKGLVDGMERNQVASTFLKLLVANKKEMVDLDQHDNYEEIIVKIL